MGPGNGLQGAAASRLEWPETGAIALHRIAVRP